MNHFLSLPLTVIAGSAMLLAPSADAAVISLPTNSDWRFQIGGNGNDLNYAFGVDDYTDAGVSSVSGTGTLAGERNGGGEFAVFWGFEIDAAFSAALATDPTVQLDFDVTGINGGTPNVNVFLLDYTGPFPGQTEAAAAGSASGPTLIGNVPAVVGEYSFTFSSDDLASTADGNYIWIGFDPPANTGTGNNTLFLDNSSATTLTTVPEPASAAMLALGGLCLLTRGRRG